MDAKI